MSQYQIRRGIRGSPQTAYNSRKKIPGTIRSGSHFMPRGNVRKEDLCRGVLSQHHIPKSGGEKKTKIRRQIKGTRMLGNLLRKKEINLLTWLSLQPCTEGGKEARRTRRGVRPVGLSRKEGRKVLNLRLRTTGRKVGGAALVSTASMLSVSERAEGGRKVFHAVCTTGDGVREPLQKPNYKLSFDGRF